MESRAPFRSYLHPVATKLANTAKWARQELQKLYQKNKYDEKPSTADIALDEVYLSKGELMGELVTVRQCLCDTGNAVVTVSPTRCATGERSSLRGARLQRNTWDWEAICNGARAFVNWIIEHLQDKQPLLCAGTWNEAGMMELVVFVV